MRALRPDSQWIVELATETREARREEIVRRIHGRVVDFLRSQPAVTQAEIERLDSLQGREFMDALREIAGDPPPGFGDRRRHDRSREEPAPPSSRQF